MLRRKGDVAKLMLRIIAPALSPRLAYVAGWLEAVWGIPVTTFQSGSEAAQAPGPCIAYGAAAHPDAVLHIPDEGLLWRTGYDQAMSLPSAEAALKAGFAIASGSGANAPAGSFDVFSHLFYHLARYEEYGAAARDVHGRYPATESVFYRAGLLRTPVLDEWLFTLKAALVAHFSFPETRFEFQPTYDIDAAWALRHKGFVRVAGQLLREAARGRVGQAAARAALLLRRGKDPHDAYDFLEALHTAPGASRPRFFFLAATRRTGFDKNISLKNPAMRSLIQRLARIGGIGLHPSYYATGEATFLQEKKSLEAAAGVARITHSRQHFMRLRIPDTYRMLIAHGIADDWTMGYGSHLGFRAGTGRSFLWYDLEREQITGLRVHPFCFMDSTAHYYEKLAASAAFAELRSMETALRRCESRLVTVFHNYSLGSDAEWAGWREAYERFAKQQ